MALLSSAGSLSVVANTTNTSKSSLLSSGLVPRTLAFPSGSSKSSGPNSLAVKALNTPEGSQFYSPYNSWLNYKPALIDSPPYVRTPWGHAVTEKEIMMSFDMPGVEASELEVSILADELNIMFKGPKDKLDVLGRKITGLYDTRIQLPPNCVRDKAEAEFRNGILYVRIPRISFDREVPIYIPVRTAV